MIAEVPGVVWAMLEDSFQEGTQRIITSVHLLDAESYCRGGDINDKEEEQNLLPASSWWS